MKPISNTAFYCCGVRMDDAENPQPVCNDVYAKNFMDERGLQIFAAFKTEKNPNAGNVARHRIIDDIVRTELLKTPELQIILIGAGFDSRAYRLTGGNWLELDEPQIIAYKNARLPIAECPNKLQRIAIDFATESLADKLQPFVSVQPVLIIFEGVFIYLPVSVIQQSLQTLQQLFPCHQLVCDLMTQAFYQKYSHTLHQKFGEFGAQFQYIATQPAQVFFDGGYQLLEKQSILGKAVEFGTVKVPKLIFNLFMKTLQQGYVVYRFATKPSEC